jgi:hypothetical protein
MDPTATTYASQIPVTRSRCDRLSTCHVDTHNTSPRPSPRSCQNSKHPGVASRARDDRLERIPQHFPRDLEWTSTRPNLFLVVGIMLYGKHFEDLDHDRLRASSLSCRCTLNHSTDLALDASTEYVRQYPGLFLELYSRLL